MIVYHKSTLEMQVYAALFVSLCGSVLEAPQAVLRMPRADNFQSVFLVQSAQLHSSQSGGSSRGTWQGQESTQGRVTLSHF